MSEPLIRRGWKIYFHPLFNEQYKKLRSKTSQIKSKRSESDFKKHSEVKLFAALVTLINEKIPNDPLGAEFALSGTLKRFSRAKGMGLPRRYRLFFWVDLAEFTIIILWLGYPRKEGDKKDCYAVFTKMVFRGEIPQKTEDLRLEIEE